VLRHVARLYRFGGGQNFKGWEIVTVNLAYGTQLITGGATVLRVGYKTMLQAEQAEKFLVYPPTCVTFMGYGYMPIHRSQMTSTKNCRINLLGKDGNLECVPFLATCLIYAALWRNKLHIKYTIYVKVVRRKRRAAAFS